ncbi:IclR family transcriptional regulator [Leucobacter luti]|uniref:IclR family transcriptional regulator n=1 Tax=Leucobacter luti TaxID=340320 RepID=A0A4Q7U0R1_9MICO|nr:IclR family transcriptional regulator [Leucobacter luti]MBL3699481.1 IclR family transcriptional regulator [Leucobacter luti]RZT66991.1 IclR family transcriptional regulator [Leucobacter luti]
MATSSPRASDRDQKKGDGLLNRAVKVLRVVSTYPNGIGLSELARLAEVPKASCFRIISTLEDEGILFTDEDTKRTRISIGALSIVGGLLTEGGTLRAIRDILSDLSEASGETTGFDMLQGSDVVVLMQNAGPSIIGQTLKQTPRIQPPWLTSTGKSLLSYRDPDEVRALLLPHYPQDNLNQLDLFIESLEPARVHGYAWLYGALERDAASVAAPVLIDEVPKYALWIGGPTYRITPENARQLGQLAIDAATKVARLLTALREVQGLNDPISASSIGIGF